MYRQDPPFCVQIEPTQGCNLRCSFCGINGIKGAERTYDYMSVKTAEAIASQMADADWNSRIELAMHGETSLNPNINEIVAVFRKHLPKASILMLSNGGGLADDPIAKIGALFDAGLNTLAIEEYQNIKLVPKIIARINKDYNSYKRMLWDSFYIYPEQKEGNPHARQHHKARRLVHVRPIDLNTSGNHATLNNHAGSGGPRNDKAAGRACAKPFRELSFRWDGSTAVCCNDWRGNLPTGNIHREGLAGIWQGAVMQAARRKLLIGERDFGPCKGCDALSYRTGLLPDKYGRESLPKPTRKDSELLAAASAGKPLTKPVKREWE